MHLTYTPEQERLRQQLQAYFAGLMTPDVRAALQGGDYGEGDAYKEVVRQLGRDGWLVLSWPQEYGGRNAPLIEQLIFLDEAAIAKDSYIEMKKSKEKVAPASVKIARSADGSKVMFVVFSFPKTVHGKPTIGPDEKGIDFACKVKDANLKFHFEPQKMDGKQGRDL